MNIMSDSHSVMKNKLGLSVLAITQLINHFRNSSIKMFSVG